MESVTEYKEILSKLKKELGSQSGNKNLKSYWKHLCKCKVDLVRLRESLRPLRESIKKINFLWNNMIKLNKSSMACNISILSGIILIVI